MSYKISATAGYLAVKGLVSTLDKSYTPPVGYVGVPKSKLSVYAGVRPTNSTDDITNQTLLVEWELPNPAFIGDDTTQIVNIAVLPEALAADTGEATFFRITDSQRASVAANYGEVVVEGTVTDRNGDGDLKIAATNVVRGLYVRLTQLIIRLQLDQSI